MPTPPLFEPLVATNPTDLGQGTGWRKTDIDIWADLWLKYVANNFKKQKPAPVIQAFEYNLKHINTTLDIEHLKAWVSTLLTSKKHYPSGIPTGKYLRQLYEHSDKSEAVIATTLFTLTFRLSHQDRMDFIRAKDDNGQTFAEFYKRNIDGVINLMKNTTEHKDKDTDNKNRYKALVQNVFSIEYMHRINTVDYPLSELFNTLENVYTDKYNFSKLFDSPEQKFEFILSGLYLVNTIHSMYSKFKTPAPADLSKAEAALETMFLSNYPRQYKIYETLKSMDITLPLLELNAQLSYSESTNAIPLPEITL